MTEPIVSINLPCGHQVDEPSKGKVHHIVCKHDGRKWAVQYKGGEFLAREE